LPTSVAYQLLSTKAASAIWARVTDALPDITPDTILAADEEPLRTAGLSRPKIAHLKSIATAIKTDVLNLDRIAGASLEEAHKELLTVKGIYADLWKPYRGVAAHLLWGWVNAQRTKAKTST